MLRSCRVNITVLNLNTPDGREADMTRVIPRPVLRAYREGDEGGVMDL